MVYVCHGIVVILIGQLHWQPLKMACDHATKLGQQRRNQMVGLLNVNRKKFVSCYEDFCSRFKSSELDVSNLAYNQKECQIFL